MRVEKEKKRHNIYLVLKNGYILKISGGIRGVLGILSRIYIHIKNFKLTKEKIFFFIDKSNFFSHLNIYKLGYPILMNKAPQFGCDEKYLRLPQGREVS